MSWVYDSGLAAPIRTLVRNAVIAKLAPLTIAGGGWLEAVIPIGFSIKGPGDELGIELLEQELNGRVTAIAVSTSKCSLEITGDATRARGRLAVDLYVISSHRRGVTEGRVSQDVVSLANNARDPGLDAALELAWMFLQDVDLGLGGQVQGLRMSEEEELIASEDVTIWQQSWQVWIQRDVNQLRASTQKLIRLHTTLVPAGNQPAAARLVLDTDV